MSDMQWTEIVNLIRVESLVTFLLILFRVAGVLLAGPILGNRNIPAPYQIAFAFMISALLLPQIHFEPGAILASNLLLFQVIAIEVTIGVLIGIVAMVIFSAIQSAGEIVGMKIGFSIANVIDPANQGSSSLFASFYVILGALLFLHLDGHHALIEALVQSFRVIPVGEGFNVMAGLEISDKVAELLVVAIKISAPIIIVLTLLNFIFGLLTKISPQMNIYFNVGFIIGPVLGLITIIFSLPLFRILITNLTEGMTPELFDFVREMKGS